MIINAYYINVFHMWYKNKSVKIKNVQKFKCLNVLRVYLKNDVIYKSPCFKGN